MKRAFIAALLGFALILLPACTSSKPQTQSTPQQKVTDNNTLQQNITAPQQNSSTPQAKVFTLDELKKYDGKNGNPAYVAVNGIVYDVSKSSRWKGGSHEDCSNAGKDLSDVINSSPHGSIILKRMPVVGTFKK
jgi:predicted heme/steroid binding protein